MERFLEEKRREENLHTFNFLKGLDERADAKNIKMLYLYREGAEAQYKGLAQEVMQTYREGAAGPDKSISNNDSKKVCKRLRATAMLAHRNRLVVPDDILF
jgi:hypothetical protein